MRQSLLNQFIFFFFALFLFVWPFVLKASEINTLQREIELSEQVEAPKEMTQKQMNDLFGEDPYLGQTSYLQSPEGFSQKDKSK